MEKQETNQGEGTNAGMGLLGEYLKQKRLDKNFTLEKLSQKTKISVNILKSLEANDYDHLPSAAYIKGFVQSYVKVLGIPQDEAITKMEYTYLNVLGKPFPFLNHTKGMATPTPGQPAGVQRTPTEETPTPHEVIESGDSIIDSTKSILPIVIFGAVILLFVGGYKLISTVVESEVNGQQEKDLGPKIESSSALVKQPEKAPEPPKTEATATTAASTEATPPAAEVKKEEVKPEPDFPRNFPTIEFKKVRGKLFSVKTDAPENEDTAILPQQIKDSMNSDIQNIYIRATEGNTWLSYKIDANPIESVIINKDSDLFLQGNEIRIFLGNVKVTKIFYNNYLIETPTKSGVKSLIFPEESNAKFQLPLFPKAKDDILYTAEDYIKRMKLEEEELEKRKANQ
ncbi:helix-turn-helix domain-containing protein [Peredibacter starrii]|uniref:Helix-turn-helix transcriptional regulator n=1 Tax=Peredibacter starrii TaxID=28202 RepID=A0AAX4HP47_9BACT|nr:helix-turn-helix transcriptional regulator [Peredibacter starrii]WPU64967.1 helix-turn-helix transcriptional regulator [Peredibacter starrii]